MTGALETSFLFPGGFFLVFVLVALASVVLWIWSLVDALGVSDHRWAAAGQNKLLWVLLIVLLGLLGSILYAAMVRPALRQPGYPRA